MTAAAATLAARAACAESDDQAQPGQEEHHEADGPMPALPLSRIFDHAGVDVIGCSWSWGSLERHGNVLR